MPSLKFDYKPGTLASQRPSAMVFSPRLLSEAEQVAAGRAAQAKLEEQQLEEAKEEVKGVSAIEAATAELEGVESVPPAETEVETE